jgi:2',3'-cyclic-nucleotide 2'-phosphodiesterase (5'-nucleotidase family)
MGIVDNWLVHCPNVSVDEYVYLDSIKTATSTCASLRQRGAQMVIALTHCQGDIDEALSRIEGIDLVLGGHSNSYETWRFDSNQCGTKTCGASNLTQVVATYVHGVDSKANINWPPCRFTIHKNIPANATVKQILSELREISENNLKTPIGATGITLKGSAHLVRTSECPIGNMLTDIMKQYTYGTHIAFLNGGAIRMNEEIPPKILTVEDILRILPFNDYLATVELTGHQVKALLENCVSKYPEPNGRFCHVSNGLMCVFSNQVDDKVVRVQSVTMWNNAIEGNAIFSCVMPGYMAEGKEGFKVLKGLKLMRPREFCPSLYNVIFEFFRKRSLAQSLQSRDQVVEFETLRPRVEKRIKAVGVFTTTKTITNSHDLGETQLSMEESQFNVDDLDAGSVMSTDAVGESDSQILEDD